MFSLDQARTLPYRGLGLSSNLVERDAPHPYALLEARPHAFDFLEYSAPLDVAQARAEASLFETMFANLEQVPALFHPVHLNLYGPSLEPASALAALDAHAREVGSAWVGNDVGWWHEQGQAFPGYLYIPPPFTAAGIADCVRHARHVQSHLSVPLVLENPAVMRKRGELHVLDFMAALHRETGFPLLLDVGHLWSYQLVAGLPPTAGFEGFPFAAVVEIHIAGGVVTEREGRRFYVDDHTQPIPEALFELLAEVVSRCPNLRALTYEGDGHPDALAERMLARLRTFMPAPSATIPDVTFTGVEGRTGSSTATDPWRLFEEAHGIRAAAEDPEGAEVEQDFRFAVIAEHVDARFPLTRALVAPDRAGLARFTASSEYRAIFEGTEHTLESAFARFARGLIFVHTELAPVLAFETWAQQLARKPSGPRSSLLGPGLELAPGVSVGTFAQDLGELLLSRTALRRHLGQRAWGCGKLEASGLAVMRDLARRAPPGPWSVAVRWRGNTLEAFGLPAADAPEMAWEPLLRARVVEKSPVL